MSIVCASVCLTVFFLVVQTLHVNMTSNQNPSTSTDARSQKLQDAINKADADLNRHKSVDVHRKEAMALKRREKAIAKANNFLEEIRFQVQPHLLNIWKLIVTDEDKGLVSVSKVYQGHEESRPN